MIIPRLWARCPWNMLSYGLTCANDVSCGMAAPPLHASAEQVVALRLRMRLSQADFARMLRVSLRTLQNWEQGRRSPTGPAAALLRVMDREPRAALRALHGFVPRAAAEMTQADEALPGGDTASG